MHRDLATSSPSPGFLSHQSDTSHSSHQSSPASPRNEYRVIQDANMTQLELLNHCINSRFGLPPSSEDPDKTLTPGMLVENALSCSFLMNEMLAFAALHLAHLNPEKAQFYRHHAVGLQTHALSIFNREMTNVTRENCVGVLFFTWFMSLHALWEAMDSVDIHDFLDRFVNYMQLHRGVRAVTSEAWHFMVESEMGFILEAASKAFDDTIAGSHTVELKSLVQDSERLNDDEKIICHDALDRIQWFLSRVDEPRKPNPSLITTFLSVTSWPVIINADFLRLVSERRPEALLILSYYAIPLHLCRSVWVVGNSGQLLIQSVRLHLDEKWHKWLDWPEEMMDTPF